ncbi:hypothetical protein EV702DRAFT_1152217 [Suillus placidus]|uniref:Myb/SANT-like domain-containing protein n=1 Tax=Suillus placidus TaxID=48579 RepID=A0A9P6ZGP7_9AGAM|nr:hypothetical protein EV702DRAFT_1152217 [Suillus placidus]
MSSSGSSHSLRSRGTIDVAAAAAAGTNRKAPAVWSKAEEITFLEFLVKALPSSGDGGFKMPTFNQASAELKTKYPNQRGAEKTGAVCKNKWTAPKNITPLSRMSHILFLTCVLCALIRLLTIVLLTLLIA